MTRVAQNLSRGKVIQRANAQSSNRRYLISSEHRSRLVNQTESEPVSDPEQIGLRPDSSREPLKLIDRPTALGGDVVVIDVERRKPRSVLPFDYWFRGRVGRKAECVLENLQWLSTVENPPRFSRLTHPAHCQFEVRCRRPR
jgi:hypothetical protein